MKESLKDKVDKAKAKVKRKSSKVANSEKEYEEMLLQVIKEDFGIED